MPDFLPSAVFWTVWVLLLIWAAFWVIRLAVRYGVDDALRKHRELTGRSAADRAERREA
jgi:hypothetical protein